MANHLRQQIRAAALAAVTGLATTGSKAFAGRVSPLAETELPGLVVYTTGDDGQNDTLGPNPTATHTGMVRIEGVAASGDTTLDDLDHIEKEVVTALYANAPFLALLQFKPLAHSSQISLEQPVEGTARRIGSVVISIPIQYRTALGDPSVQA